MAHSLTVTLDENTYDHLMALADREGQSAEEWVRATVANIFDDPLIALAGSIDSGVPDLAERHDQYLGEILAGDR